jgi:hypothetical protein
MGSLGLLVQMCLSRVRPPRLVIFEKVLIFWFFQNEPLGVKGAIVTKAQICKVHVSLEPIGSDYREPIGYRYIFVDIVNPLGRITLVNLVTRNPERLETMTKFDYLFFAIFVAGLACIIVSMLLGLTFSDFPRVIVTLELKP